MQAGALVGRLDSCDGVGRANIPVELKWRFVPPEVRTTVAERKWSKSPESVRKDVECFFERLKGRFRILKMPLMFWASNANLRGKIDNIVLVCGILQNMLHACNALCVLEPGTGWCGHGGMDDAFCCDPTTDPTQMGMSGMRANDSGQRIEVETGFF
ncbi:unnamed protein product [Discosporangium mesarthrocarpum]